MAEKNRGLKNLGWALIAGGSAIALVILGREAFGDSGTLAGSVQVDTVNYNSIVDDPVKPSFLVGGTGIFTIINTGTKDFDIGVEMVMVSSSPSGNKTQSLPAIETKQVLAGQSVPLDLLFGFTQPIDAPAVMDITFRFKANGQEIFRVNDKKVLTEGGAINNF